MVSKYQRALKLAYRSKRRPTHEVYELLLAADKDGDARATYALATWHLHGNRFCKKDYRQAAQMLKRAAQADIADAAFDLAVPLKRGWASGNPSRKRSDTMSRPLCWGTLSPTMRWGACIIMELERQKTGIWPNSGSRKPKSLVS